MCVFIWVKKEISCLCRNSWSHNFRDCLDGDEDNSLWLSWKIYTNGNLTFLLFLAMYQFLLVKYSYFFDRLDQWWEVPNWLIFQSTMLKGRTSWIVRASWWCTDNWLKVSWAPFRLRAALSGVSQPWLNTTA